MRTSRHLGSRRVFGLVVLSLLATQACGSDLEPFPGGGAEGAGALQVRSELGADTDVARVEARLQALDCETDEPLSGVEALVEFFATLTAYDLVESEGGVVRWEDWYEAEGADLSSHAEVSFPFWAEACEGDSSGDR